MLGDYWGNDKKSDGWNPCSIETRPYSGFVDKDAKIIQAKGFTGGKKNRSWLLMVNPDGHQRLRPRGASEGEGDTTQNVRGRCRHRLLGTPWKDKKKLTGEKKKRNLNRNKRNPLGGEKPDRGLGAGEKTRVGRGTGRNHSASNSYSPIWAEGGPPDLVKKKKRGHGWKKLKAAHPGKVQLGWGKTIPIQQGLRMWGSAK